MCLDNVRQLAKNKPSILSDKPNLKAVSEKIINALSMGSDKKNIDDAVCPFDKWREGLEDDYVSEDVN